MPKPVQAIRAALLGAALAVLVLRAEAVELSMRDTTFNALDTLRVDIGVDSIAESQNVLSYQFVLLFDSAVLAGVGGDAAGTITEPFGDPFTSGDIYPGELRLAAAGIQPVSGSGPFVTLLLRAVSELGGVSIIRFDSALLNEGDPPVTYSDTLARITATPPNSVGPRGSPHSLPVISVVPNPARDHIALHFPSRYMTGQVTLWNVLGQKMGVYSAEGQRLEISLGVFPAGTYFATFDKQPGWSNRILLIK